MKYVLRELLKSLLNVGLLLSVVEFSGYNARM
jgi:hypothetical protein